MPMPPCGVKFQTLVSALGPVSGTSCGLVLPYPGYLWLVHSKPPAACAQGMNRRPCVKFQRSMIGVLVTPEYLPPTV